ncbi:MAG: iron-containing alcohol dehydrogenase, partial [Armatimonadota bacterium]
MIRASIFPNKYIQGRDAINQVVDFVEALGKSVLLLIDRNVRPFVERPITSSLAAKDIKFEMTEFGGECTWAEIHRVVEITKRLTAQVIIRAGGGKTIDTAKAAAIQAGCRMLILPTTASTDAPTSALSVIYTEEGEFLEYYFLPRNPDV